MKTWSVCGVDIAPGEKKQITLQPNTEGYGIPATALCGMEDRMTVVITAGIHSDEYPGIAASIKLASELDPLQLKGRLLIIHCMNISGFWAHSPAVVPEDGTNLNRIYPGCPNGGVGDRIADYIVREVFPHADFLIDLHSGGLMEPLTPLLFLPAEEANEKLHRISISAAQATDIPYLISSNDSRGHCGYAAKHMEIPVLVIERGHSGLCLEEWVQGHLKDLRLLLHHFGLYRMNDPYQICGKKHFREASYLVSDVKGLWYPAIQENMYVKKGELIGRTEDFYGGRIKEYYADTDATVFYYACGLAANIGDILVVMGYENFVE